MTDPLTEIARARIRYLSANLRGEITDIERDRKLAMLDRTEKRLETKASRLVHARELSREWKLRHRIVKKALEASHD